MTKISAESYIFNSILEDYLKTKHQLLEKIKTTFDKEGISIPYKQLDVHVINN